MTATTATPVRRRFAAARVCSQIIGKLGSAFTAGIDLSGGLMEDHETKRAYLMVALNVYGGPEGMARARATVNSALRDQRAAATRRSASSGLRRWVAVGCSTRRRST